jgi:hypothetical protein
MTEILFESYYGVEPLGGAYLAHHGVKGQKHGERQYQNLDGSLTPLGRKHYGVGPPREKSKDDNVAVRAVKATGKVITGTGRGVAKTMKGAHKAYKDFRKEHAKNAALSGNIKSVLRNRKYMDAATYAAAIDRIDKTIKLNELRAKDTSKTFKRFERAANKFGKAADIFDTFRTAHRKIRERDKDPNYLTEYKKYIVDTAKKAADEARKNGGEAGAAKAYLKTVDESTAALKKYNKGAFGKFIQKLLGDDDKNTESSKPKIEDPKVNEAYQKYVAETAEKIAEKVRAEGGDDTKVFESYVKTVQRADSANVEKRKDLTNEQKKSLKAHIDAFDKSLKEAEEEEKKKKK